MADFNSANQSYPSKLDYMKNSAAESGDLRHLGIDRENERSFGG